MNRIRDFEKVSKEQFIQDCRECGEEFYNVAEDAYEIVTKPRRATRRSSGYDFVSPFSFMLEPNENIKFPLGIKVYMLEDEELLIFPRSSVGFKFRIKIDNTIGKIDSDFYNNPTNEGDIHISLTNTGSKYWTVKAGDKICQGSFYKYLITDTDNPEKEDRVGGIGSTDER
jgi:dUTP pyrophosphatase